MSFLEKDRDYSKIICRNWKKIIKDKIIRQIKAWIYRNIRKIMKSEEDYYKPNQ